MQPIVDGRFRKALDLLKWFSIAALAGAVTSTCQAQLLYTGVNLAGADFGPTPTPGNTGTFGTDYTYPTDRRNQLLLERGDEHDSSTVSLGTFAADARRPLQRRRVRAR